MTDKIGIMDGAYFVGRNELLSWLNALLEINYKKVEQISNGAAMCQVMDAMYPNKSALSKVNYNATMDFEVLNNFKILQSEFKRVGVEKVVDIERLKQGRFQDNLEFFQWMKRYYDINHRSDVSSYRARERRREANCPEPKEIYGGLPLGRSSSSPAAAAAASKRQKYTPSTAVPSSVLSSSSTSAYHSTRPNSKNLVVPLAPAPLMAAASSVSRRPAQQQQQQQQQHTTFSVSTRPGRAGATGRSTQVNTSGVMGSKTGDDHGRNGSNNMGLKAKHASNDPGDIKAVVSVRELTSLQETISSLEKERDFYYERLVRVETLCKAVKNGSSSSSGSAPQKYPGANKKLVSAILRILYDDGTTGNYNVDDDDDDNDDDDENVTMRTETHQHKNTATTTTAASPITPQQGGKGGLFEGSSPFTPPVTLPSPLPQIQSSAPTTTTTTTTITATPQVVPSSSSSGYAMGSNCGMGNIGETNISAIGSNNISLDSDINMN